MKAPEWYQIHYKREPNCNLSKETIREILKDSLRDLTPIMFNSGLESIEWDFWERKRSDLETISKRLPHVLLTVDVEIEKEHGLDRFYRYYAKNGTVKSVDGHITYPEFVENKELAYIRDFIKEEIDYYDDNLTNHDSIDDDTVRAIVNSYTCIKTMIDFARNFEHITEDEANAERQRFIEHFGDTIKF